VPTTMDAYDTRECGSKDRPIRTAFEQRWRGIAALIALPTGTYLDRSGSDGPAARIHRSERADTDGAERKSILGTCVRLPWAPRRFDRLGNRESENLKLLILKLKRMNFGRSSERLDQQIELRELPVAMLALIERTFLFPETPKLAGFAAEDVFEFSFHVVDHSSNSSRFQKNITHWRFLHFSNGVVGKSGGTAEKPSGWLH
jgi:hypothetical protein